MLIAVAYSLRYERLKNLEFSIKNTWLYEEDTNLCILTLQKEDIEVIIKNPASIIKIFNHQAESAKKIKVLNDGEQ